MFGIENCLSGPELIMNYFIAYANWVKRARNLPPFGKGEHRASGMKGIRIEIENDDETSFHGERNKENEIFFRSVFEPPLKGVGFDVDYEMGRRCAIPEPDLG